MMNKIINFEYNRVAVALCALVFVLVLYKLGISRLFFLVFAGIVLVAVFSAILESNTFALGLIFTTAFTRVIFYLMGVPRVVPCLFTELCVLLLLSKAIYLQLYIHRKPLRAFGFFPMLGILVISCVSYIWNESEVLPVIFFFRQLFIFYLFFVALQNLNLTEYHIQRINKYIIFLFLIQIPAALIKYLIVGQDEFWIGTVSWLGGQFSTMLPLFAISFVFAFYFFRKDWKCFVLFAGFSFFGIAGQKRSLALLVPVVGVAVWYLYGKRKILKRKFQLNVSQLKSFIVVLIIGYLGIFAASRLLNSSEMYDGRMDIKKITSHVISYNTRNDLAIYDPNQRKKLTMGRYTICMLSLEKMRESGVLTQLLGFGPGTMIFSPHVRDVHPKEVLFNKFGMRGTATGFTLFLLSIGFIGVALLLYFFVKLFIRVYKLYQISSNPDFKIIALGFLGATFVLFLDFFLYGKSTLCLGVITPVYYYIAAVILNKEYRSYKLF